MSGGGGVVGSQKAQLSNLPLDGELGAWPGVGGGGVVAAGVRRN